LKIRECKFDKEKKRREEFTREYGNLWETKQEGLKPVKRI